MRGGVKPLGRWGSGGANIRFLQKYLKNCKKRRGERRGATTVALPAHRASVLPVRTRGLPPASSAATVQFPTLLWNGQKRVIKQVKHWKWHFEITTYLIDIRHFSTDERSREAKFCENRFPVRRLLIYYLLFYFILCSGVVSS